MWEGFLKPLDYRENRRGSYREAAMEIPCTSMTSANQLSIISVVRLKNLMGTMWREAQDTDSELQVETDAN